MWEAIISLSAGLGVSLLLSEITGLLTRRRSRQQLRAIVFELHELSDKLESLERRPGYAERAELVDILQRASMRTMNEAWGRRVVRQVERLSDDPAVLETVRTAEGVLDERFGVREAGAGRVAQTQ